MSANTLAIPFGFIILAMIILWIMIGIKGNWWMKSCIIVITSFFSLAVWMAMPSYMGWPAHDELPSKYQVFWIVVSEPNKESSGAIFVWLRGLESTHNKYNLFEYKASLEPRAYHFKYSRELHEQSQRALNGLKEGRAIVGGKEMIGNPESHQGENGKGGGGISENAQPYFWELPEGYLPQKDGQ